MNLFDTHCHFETRDENEISAILSRAAAAGVSRIVAVGGSAELNASALIAADIASRDSSLPRVFAALGRDRDQCATPPDELPALPRVAGGLPVAAVGEIGLDYHYSPETRDAQRALFGAELERARALQLPVVIHTREADEDTLGLLREIPSRGVIHCFTGTPEFCRALLDLGFFISISGIVTFRLADNVRASALAVPDDMLLIETDSPFLAPVPMRGKANEPAFIVHTAKFLAALRGVDAETLAAQTEENAMRAFAATPARTS